MITHERIITLIGDRRDIHLASPTSPANQILQKTIAELTLKLYAALTLPHHGTNILKRGPRIQETQYSLELSIIKQTIKDRR